MSKDRPPPLCDLVANALDGYFKDLNGTSVTGLYDVVMEEVERPLLKSVMQNVDHNQSKAAALLGMNRGTLRKKLKTYGLL